MEVRQLADMQALARAQFDRDAAELRGALAAEARLQAGLEEIAAAEARRAAALGGDLGIAFAQTGEALWQSWAAARRRELLMALANQRAVTEAIKLRACRAFGRCSALETLECEARAAEDAAARRRELEGLLDLALQARWRTVSPRARLRRPGGQCR